MKAGRNPRFITMRKTNTQIPIFYGYTDKNYVYIDKYGCNGTIDFEHAKIHDGDHYLFSDYFTVTGNGVLNLVLSVDGYENHFTYTVNSDQAGFSLVSYEGVTAAEDGTLLAIHNNNRESTNFTSSTIRLNPTNIVTTGATQIRRGYAGTGLSPSNRNGGSVARTNEVVLKKNTKYLIRITNLSSSNNDIQVVFSYYETE